MEKYVKLMADYCSSGIWNKLGQSLDLDSIPLSNRLKTEITVWVEYYDKFSPDHLPEESVDLKNAFDYKSFSLVGLVLADKIKQELPGWTVVYFDDSKVNDDPLQFRNEYEYEIK